ncbi:MAG: hypothetical protein PHC51_10505 [bacterium]|nr:hypothetical protein [bacterium]
MRNKTLVTALVLLVFPFTLQAENSYRPGEVGRLPDGRPYRVDASGYRLTDYIAELEVSLDDLKRQVVALENEVADKQKIISRYADGRGLEGARVEEEDLLSPSRKNVAAAQPAQVANVAALQQCQVARAEAEERLAQVAQNDKLAGDDQGAVASCNLEKDRALAKVRELSDELRESSILARNLEHEATDARDARETAAEMRARLADASGQSDALEKKLEWQKRSEERLLADNEKLQEQVAELSGKLQSLASDNEKLEKKYALLMNAPRMNTARADDTPSVTVSEDRDEDEFLPAQSRQGYARALQQSLGSIQSQIMARKSLLDQLKSSNRGVSPSVQRLSTRSGQSLDQLRSAVKNAGSTSEFNRITKGLDEINSILSQDISMLKRLLHGR